MGDSNLGNVILLDESLSMIDLNLYDIVDTHNELTKSLKNYLGTVIFNDVKTRVFKTNNLKYREYNPMGSCNLLDSIQYAITEFSKECKDLEIVVLSRGQEFSSLNILTGDMLLDYLHSLSESIMVKVDMRYTGVNLLSLKSGRAYSPTRYSRWNS